MNNSTEPGHKQIEPGSQPRPEIPSNPTVQQMKGWDRDELLQWIQLKKPNLLSGENLERFITAEILGGGFLWAAGDRKFFMDASLPVGISQELAILSHEVKEGGNLSDQTADRKRKADSEQAGLAEQSDAASKRRRRDIETNHELQKLAKRARKRRRRILKKIKALGLFADDADQLPNAAVQLSNPAFHDMLPFPFVGPAVPTRFRAKANSEDSWFYVGREIFMGLLDRLRHIQRRRDRTALWVYGTKGSGKSHLLAALVCYLTARKERVVYIPDCRECARSPIGYVQAAMLFAFADNKAIQDEIITLNTQEEIRKFFRRHPNLTFFIGQVNGFDGLENNEVKQWLHSCRVWHKAVLSTSANYESYLKTALKQNTEVTCHVYNGFTPAEMEQWWKRNEDVTPGDYTKAEVEDFTGCIPLLLDMCVVNKKIDLRVQTMKSVWDEVASFVSNMKENAAPEAWEIYQKYVDACIERRPVPAGVRPELIDHRYFYKEEDVGSYACGIAREAVAGQLRLHGRNRFGNTALLSLDDYISNESVVGFFIKQAILQTIESRGLEMITEISQPMKMIPFKGYPAFDTSNELALYVPCNFNYYAIDGIILRLDRSSGRNGERKKAILFPLQITIAKSHKNSEEHFFNQWRKWTASLRDFDIEVRFLWISIENPSHTNVGESSRSLKHKDMIIHPAYTSRWIHLEEVNKDVWNRYSEALNDEMMPKPKLAVFEGQASRTSKEQGDAEEQEIAEEQVAEEQEVGEEEVAEEEVAEEQEVAEEGIMRQHRAKKAMLRDEVPKEEDAPRGRGSKSSGESKSGGGTRKSEGTRKSGGTRRSRRTRRGGESKSGGGTRRGGETNEIGRA